MSRRGIVWPSLPKMAAVLDEVGKSAEKLVDEEKDEIVDGEDKTGAAEASKKKKKKKKKKKAGAFCSYNILRTTNRRHASTFPRHTVPRVDDDVTSFLTHAAR